MKICIFRNWTGAWTPTPEEWERHRSLLYPLCVGGNISFRKKEDLVSFFATRGIEAVEKSKFKSDVNGQLMLF